MLIAAVDPGPTMSALVTYDTEARAIRAHAKLDNRELLELLSPERGIDDSPSLLAVEMIASYGMPVGAEVFDTCVWIGRFVERWGGLPHRLVYRREVKLHMCGSVRAKDGNIRKAVLERFGRSEKLAKGTKGQPGPLYGIKADEWSALAIALTVADALERPHDSMSLAVANSN